MAIALDAMRHTQLLLILCGTLPCLCSAKPVVWSNVVPRRNVTGEIMDAHDGTYNQWGGPGTPFYYYAMGYGDCKQGQDMCHGCGYGYSWIGVWKSADLSSGSWTLLGDARRDDGTWPQQSEVSAYFRVHTIFNKRTAKYVMWVNVDNCPAEPGPSPKPGPAGACYAVGTSSNPEGPFDYVGRSTARYPSAGDFDLLVDDDGRAYIIYTSTSMGHVMSIELLNDDFTRTLAAGPTPLAPPSKRALELRPPDTVEDTASTSGIERTFTKRPYTREESSAAAVSSSSLLAGVGDGPTNTSSGIFGNHFVEAPAIFKRNGVYYALFGECCCFCGQGSGIGVYTAAAPLGPWTYHENIGCEGGEPKPGCGCGMNGGSPPALECPPLYGTSVTKAQQNFVIQVHTPSGLEYVWTGDMWQSADDGIKAHDLQFWAPLVFVKDAASGLELPRPVKWLDNFTIDVL